MLSIEVLAIIFSLLYIILASKENIWCWPMAIISVTLYIYICFNAKLYSETCLQIFYFFMALYGYLQWKKNKNEIRIQTINFKYHVLIISTGIILTYILGFVFQNNTDAEMPFLDAFTTIFSIITTYMVAKKILENWIYWIIIDLTSIYLYINRDLHPTAMLFLCYTIIAAFGFLSWKNKMIEK